MPDYSSEKCSLLLIHLKLKKSFRDEPIDSSL